MTGSEVTTTVAEIAETNIPVRSPPSAALMFVFPGRGNGSAGRVIVPSLYERR
jgi:hypothetical protein